MKKLSLYITLVIVSLVLGACSDEYEPWGDPQAYPEEGAILRHIHKKVLSLFLV